MTLCFLEDEGGAKIEAAMADCLLTYTHDLGSPADELRLI